jgi:hypothetical protein
MTTTSDRLDVALQHAKTLERRCAICGIAERDAKRMLARDHDHKTGNRREYLCMSCNVGLGHFQDNIERLLAAVEYLRKHLS